MLKESIKLTVNTAAIIKKIKNCRVKYSDCDWFREYANFKDNLKEYKFCVVTRTIKKSLMKIYEVRLMKELSYLKYWDVNNLYV